MVRCYALRHAIKLYHEMFPHQRVPSYDLVLGVNIRLRSFGQFTVPTNAQGRGADPYPVDLHEAISEFFDHNPRESTRNAALRFRVSQWTVLNLLHTERRHPCHFRAVQELGINDYGPRLAFAGGF